MCAALHCITAGAAVDTIRLASEALEGLGENFELDAGDLQRITEALLSLNPRPDYLQLTARTFTRERRREIADSIKRVNEERGIERPSITLEMFKVPKGFDLSEEREFFNRQLSKSFGEPTLFEEE